MIFGNVSKALDFILFRDDTNIFFSHKDPDHLMRTVNSGLEKHVKLVPCQQTFYQYQKVEFHIIQNKTK